MNSIYYDIKRRGGIAATFELLRDGHTSHQLTRAVRAGTILRVRQGHYACPEVTEPEQQAVRVGGRLTGISGARWHGIWTPPSNDLDVVVAPHARALRSPTNKSVRLVDCERPGVLVDWSGTGLTGTRSVVDPLSCLDVIVRTQPDIVAFAAVESALNKGLITLTVWHRYAQMIPRRKKGRLGTVDRVSESGGESLAKFHLLELGIRLAQQVKVAGVGRVDFLVGDALVIEADGAQFHTSRSSFEEDRRRDAVLSSLGYRVLRFSYTQISRRWPEVESAILAAIGRGDHLR